MLDSTNKVESLIDHAMIMNVQRLALTDHQSISSHVHAMKYRTKLEEKDKYNIEILFGDEIYLVDNPVETKENYQGKVTKFPHFILIAKNNVGYRQLREIDSMGWEHGWMTGRMRRTFTGKKDVERIIGMNEGHLLASTGCLGGEMGILSLRYLDNPTPKNKKAIHDFVYWCIKTFGKENFALEIQPSNQEDQIRYNQFLMKVSRGYELPIIMTNDTHYLTPEDADIHEIFLRSRDADREVREFYESTWMMPLETRWELTKGYLSEDEFEQIIKNGYDFSSGCERIEMKHDIIIPERDLSQINFKIQHIFKQWYDKCEGLRNFAYSEYIQDRFLLSEIEKGFLEKDQKFNEENINRLDEELDIIWDVSRQLDARMSSYYNLVDYIIDLCWEIGLVGVSRGSITGEYFAYLIDTHQMNPLKWGLPHWRHLSKEKAGLPEIRALIVNPTKGCAA